MSKEAEQEMDIMNNPPIEPAIAVPRATRVSSVVLGRNDFMSTLLRLIGMELYKLRRRSMSKVLGLLAVLLAVLVPLSVGFEIALNRDAPGSMFVAACQSINKACSASDAELAKQFVIGYLSAPLRLPLSLEIAVTQGVINSALLLNPAIILIIILAGSMAGGDLSLGTVRLLFARGPWRGQFLLAKYGAVLVCVVISVLGMAVLGVLVGQFFNLFSGVAQDGAFLTMTWFGQSALFLLATMLNWFLFAVIAIFFSFLGRSTVSGIVGALTWYFVEPILSNILPLAGNLSIGFLSQFISLLPNYLPGHNALALQLLQIAALDGKASAPLNAVQPLVVLAFYLAIFISLTWWLNESRDVTD